MTLTEYRKYLSQLWSVIKDPGKRGLFQAIPKRFAADVQRAFDEMRDPVTGQPWAALKWRTEPPPKLNVTGTMIKEALAAANKPAMTVKGLKFTLLSPDYAKYHHLGTSRMARRRFFGLFADTRKWIQQELAKGMAKDRLNSVTRP